MEILPHLYVCTAVPDVPGPCVRRVRGDGRGDGRGETAWSRGWIDPGLVDDVLQSSHVLNVVFIHRKHQCVLAASYLSAAYRLIDLRKRAREAKRWTLAVRSSPLSHVMCFCSPSAPRLPAAKHRTAGLRDSVCRRPTEIWRSSLKEVPLFSGLGVHAWIWPQTSFHMARGDGAVSGSWSRGSRMDGVLISVFGAFLMTLSALSLRTEIPPDSQTTEDDETFKDLRLHLIWGTLFSNL